MIQDRAASFPGLQLVQEIAVQSGADSQVDLELKPVVVIGFGVHAGTVDGVALCRMFNRALRRHRWLPKYLSSDNDPLYRFHQWQANLRASTSQNLLEFS